ncbi:hypothetical protein, partial [Histophilus somni]|uniref:hypothetical protein n=1 Tax=Histophilus somni TaxID=731 RepID=UPI00196A460C
STVYSLQSTVYSLQSTVYSLQSTVYSVVYSLKSTLQVEFVRLDMFKQHLKNILFQSIGKNSFRCVFAQPQNISISIYLQKRYLLFSVLLRKRRKVREYYCPL